MRSTASSVAEYLASLPPERREAIEGVRRTILQNLDQDFEEGMQYGMIGYYVPHRVYPDGYHCDPKQPLPFAGIASQKNYMALYLGCVYDEGDTAREFRKRWAQTGKKLDMGKACIRFRKLDDLALDVIARTIRSITAKKFIKHYEQALGTQHKPPARTTNRRSLRAGVKKMGRPGAASSRTRKRRSS